jgi:hypothetical protein
MVIAMGAVCLHGWFMSLNMSSIEILSNTFLFLPWQPFLLKIRINNN